MQDLLGIGVGADSALPPSDSDSGARQLRRDSSISLEDPSQTAQRYVSKALCLTMAFLTVV